MLISLKKKNKSAEREVKRFVQQTMTFSFKFTSSEPCHLGVSAACNHARKYVHTFAKNVCK